MNEVTLALFIIFFMWTMWPLAASKTTTFIQTAADTDPSLFSVYIKENLQMLTNDQIFLLF